MPHLLASGRRAGLRVYALLAAVAAIGLFAVLLTVAYRRSRTLSVLIKDREACHKGDARACQRVGWEYEQGALVEPDLARALDYYQRACAGNDALGCYFAGMLCEGNGKKTRAFRHYQRACQGGQSDACRSAARLVRAGLVVP